jgi:hypothetical protein
VTGVDQHQLELVLEQMPDRLPVHAGCFHGDLRDAVSLQPVAKHKQPTYRRLELGHVRGPLAMLVGHPHAGGHLLLVDIERALPLNDHIHLNPLLDAETSPAARNVENRRV